MHKHIYTCIYNIKQECHVNTSIQRNNKQIVNQRSKYTAYIEDTGFKEWAKSNTAKIVIDTNLLTVYKNRHFN